MEPLSWKQFACRQARRGRLSMQLKNLRFLSLIGNEGIFCASEKRTSHELGSLERLRR